MFDVGMPGSPISIHTGSTVFFFLGGGVSHSALCMVLKETDVYHSGSPNYLKDSIFSKPAF